MVSSEEILNEEFNIEKKKIPVNQRKETKNDISAYRDEDFWTMSTVGLFSVTIQYIQVDSLFTSCSQNSSILEDPFWMERFSKVQNTKTF